jgi:hypothetical protein
MKRERSTMSAAQKIARSLTSEEKETLEREAIEERRRIREERAKKRQER